MKKFHTIVPASGKEQFLRVVIEGSLKEEGIELLQQDLFTSLETHSQVHIVIRNLKALELPALQWILAFQRAARTEGKKVSLDMELTRTLQTLVQQSGLTAMFNRE